jgi:hypothetical protein
VASPHRYYELFLANEAYLFGAREGDETAIYIITQV